MNRASFASALAAVAGCIAIIAPASAQPAQATTKAKLQVRTVKLGRILVDGKGLTLYLFEKDKGGKSACSGSCAKEWAPLLTSGKAVAGKGISASKIGSTKRKNGSIQVTYAGHPLYHYDDDHKPGQTEGQGSNAFGAEWYVLAPSGKKLEKSSSAPAPY
jgi:predicted lipoprotein with Yx(FWY)xxD motif